MAEKAKAAVIAGVDASEGSLRAVRWAAQEAPGAPLACGCSTPV